MDYLVRISVVKNASISITNSGPPIFIKSLEQITMKLNETKIYISPEIYEPDGDLYKYTFTYEGVIEFVYKSENRLTI